LREVLSALRWYEGGVLVMKERHEPEAKRGTDRRQQSAHLRVGWRGGHEPRGE
jgi:hypothetical protein